MTKVIQIISMRGIPYGDKEKAVLFFNAVENSCKEIGFTPNGLSATCGDMFGYFTLLVGVPDNVDDKITDTVGKNLAMALFPSRYAIIEEPIENIGKWMMLATGKDRIEINR